jgi:hypothetical protein
MKKKLFLFKKYNLISTVYQSPNILEDGPIFARVGLPKNLKNLGIDLSAQNICCYNFAAVIERDFWFHSHLQTHCNKIIAHAQNLHIRKMSAMGINIFCFKKN